MCFKKKVVIDSKFKLKDMVKFRYRDELVFGYIYKVYKVDETTLYDVQLGGQCPSIITGISEDKLSNYSIK